VLIAIRLGVFMLSFDTLSVIILSAVILIVVILSVIMLNGIFFFCDAGSVIRLTCYSGLMCSTKLETI
jgi:hypothetical protein